MLHKAFYKNPKAIEEGYDIGTILGRPITKGDIGIEIEVEGNKFKKEGVPAPWGYHKDGSLRGVDNAEYVLNKPIEFDRVPEAISVLWDMFQKYGSVLDVSNRTSVHIHLNVQKFHLNRLTAFLAMYFSIEEILVHWCGDHRVGNLFCLRAKDATAIVSSLKRFIKSDGSTEIRDGMHYAGLNAQALHKFGSIEIRTMRGCIEPQTILDWVSILRRLYEMSANFPDPRDLMNNFSGGDPLNYLEMILGDQYNTVIYNVDMTMEEVRGSLYEGIRLAQDLCYCRNWSRYKPIELKVDPFGRRKKPSSPSPASAIQEYMSQFNNGTTTGMTIATTPSPMPVGWSTASAISPTYNSVSLYNETHEETEEGDDYEEEFDPFQDEEETEF